MKRLLLVLSLVLLTSSCFGMAWDLKKPKGITLRSNKTGILYSVRDWQKYTVSCLEISDFWGITLNGGLGTNFAGENYAIASLMYDIKSIHEISDAIPPTSIMIKPMSYITDLIDKIPLVEIEVGVFVGYQVSGNIKEISNDKIDYGLTATIIKVNW